MKINFEQDIKNKYNTSPSDLFKKFSAENMSYYEVAVEVGYSENTVRTWSNRIGVKLKSCSSKKNSEPLIPQIIKDALSQSWITINFKK